MVEMAGVGWGGGQLELEHNINELELLHCEWLEKSYNSFVNEDIHPAIREIRVSHSIQR